MRRELRLSIKNEAVQNNTRIFLIPSCREYEYWPSYNRSLSLLRNSPFQAPSPGLTEMAQPEGTKREQAKISPVSESSRPAVPKKTVCKSKTAEVNKRQPAFMWSKSSKQREVRFLENWKHFENTEDHPPSLWFGPKYSWKQTYRSRFSQQRRTCWNCRRRPVQRLILDLRKSFPRLEKRLLEWTETQVPVKKSDTPRADNWHRVLRGVRHLLLTNIPGATDASGLWATLGAQSRGRQSHNLWVCSSRGNDTCHSWNRPCSSTWKNKAATKTKLFCRFLKFQS